MLTQRDLNLIEKIINETIEEKTRNLPTKDEFFKRIRDLEDNRKSGRFAVAA